MICTQYLQSQPFPQPSQSTEEEAAEAVEEG
jgi:hypothetical protein